MRIKFDHVFQFKVTLKGIKPPIWRRIIIPSDYDFWDLHVAIQDAFGWLDCHLHEFSVRQPFMRMDLRIGIPDGEGFDDNMVLPGSAILLAQHLTLANRRVSYVYDFGDDWEYDILLEKILPRDKSEAYPLCTGGRRAGPPEDCGGIPGYEQLLEALADPVHPEHTSLSEWVGEGFDPESFDKDEVEFDDPGQRWEAAFGEGLEGDGMPDLRLVSGTDGATEPVDHGNPPWWDDSALDPPPEFRLLRSEEAAGYRGYPIATIAIYGPDDKRATKMAVGIVVSDAGDIGQLERWTIDKGDIRENAAVGGEIMSFIRKNGARTVILSEGVIGCPHEEGVDYPEGGVCPQCPFWAGRDRWSGEPIH